MAQRPTWSVLALRERWWPVGTRLWKTLTVRFLWQNVELTWPWNGSFLDRLTAALKCLVVVIAPLAVIPATAMAAANAKIVTSFLVPMPPLLNSPTGPAFV